MKKMLIVGSSSVLALLLATSIVVKPQDGRTVVSGYVFEVGSSNPISGSRVQLTPMEGNRRTSQPILSVTSDSKGYFEFEKVPSASYLLDASKDGFADQLYGRPTPGKKFDPDALMDITDGQRVSGLIVRLTPAGTISGKVTNKSEGIASIQVALLHKQYDSWGRLQYELSALASTNSQGEFRLPGILPGDYFIGAGTSTLVLGGGSAVRESLSRSNPAMVSDQQYPWRFYPNFNSPSSALRLTVRPKEDQRLNDIELTPELTERSIHVHMVNATNGLPLPLRGSYIGISPYGSLFAESAAWLPIFQADGEFRTRGVAPGVYWVSAYWYVPGGPTSKASGWALGIADVTKDDADIELRLVDEITLYGRVSLDGAAASRTTDLSDIAVRLMFPNPADAHINIGQSAYAETNARGEFEYRGILPGDFRVSVEGLPYDFYLKDVRLGAASVLNQAIPVRDSISESLNVILGSNPGRIDGRVVQRDGKPALRNTIVMVPDNGRDQDYLFRDTTSSPTGTFTFRGIAPGNYRVFAWSNIEEYSWFDPEVIGRYEAQGVRVHISDNSRETIELTSIQN